MPSSSNFSLLSAADTAQQLETDFKTGLGDNEAMQRYIRHGPNELVEEDESSLFKQFMAQFIENPLILMLIASAVVSLFLGNVEDAISITLALFFVVVVGFVQEYRSEQSLKALGTLVPPSAHLIRNGVSKNVLASHLVPGDIVKFSIGDRVPADVRLVEAVHLHIDESALTGETIPVEKHSEAMHHIGNLADTANTAFMGTLVTSGRGFGVVVGTGRDTEFGQIFAIMSEIEKPKTPLQQSMDKLGRQLSLLSFAVISVICVIGVLQGRKMLEMFQIGVSLAVAAIPEGLPIIVTVTLALGVLRMAKNNVIVRRLPSVETLGSVNVICSDKTGTLTMNMLHVAEVLIPGLESWLDLRKLQDSNISISHRLLDASIFCNDSQKQASGYAGNSVDIALLKFAEEYGGVDVREDPQHDRVIDKPFSSRLQIMVVGVASGSTYVKGAYERVLPMCSHYYDKDNNVVAMTEEYRQKIIQLTTIPASQGMRILALASCPKILDPHNDAENDGKGSFIFCGLTAMYDPPRAGVGKIIERLRGSGVRVVMITGDNEVTAVAAAREVGIPVPTDYHRYVMLGQTLESLDENQLASAISNILVFARTSPEMKVLIVKALQERGDIVAMTGDGVNDAPALKLADIGVSMGSGTDVAKEASDMILVNNDFSTILLAIREGKAIFTNIKSFLTFQLSTSVAALSLIVVSTMFKVPNPLNAMQVLWINILMDGPPAQSLGVEPADADELRKPPRSRSDEVLTPKIIKSVLWRGCLILLGTMYVYVHEMQDSVTARDTTMSFTTFVLFDLFNALSCRSSTHSIFKVGIFANKMFNVAVGLSLLGQLAVIYLPPFQRIFQTESLTFHDILYLLTLSSSILWVDEGIKWLSNKKKPKLHAVPLQSFV